MVCRTVYSKCKMVKIYYNLYLNAIFFTSVNAFVRGIIRTLHEKSVIIRLNSYRCEVL